jgi:phosphoserine phosphatase
LRDWTLRLVAGREYEPFAAVARAVGAQVADDVSPAARWLIDRHLDDGDFCVIVSASPQELVESVTTALGVHRAVGTRAEIHEGRLTGRTEDTVLAVISRHHFLFLVHETPTFALQVMSSMAERLRHRR